VIRIFLASLVFMSVVMAAAWAFQRHKNNGGWSDVFWPFGMGITGVASALALPPGDNEITFRQLLVAGLVSVWSFRLGVHLLRRVSRSKEDARYVVLREVVGRRFQAVMYGYLQAQAWVAAFLTLTIFVAAHNPAPGLRWVDAVATAVFMVGLAGESAADRALIRFKRAPENKGRVLDQGLWAWTRHPNLFFEWVIWIAYPVFAIDLGGGYPWGWFALSGPAAMYLVLRHMTGVPALETALVGTKGQAYRDYQARVSTFIPQPPRARV
jgi:steroid 5-alpha reductase family enzyme